MRDVDNRKNYYSPSAVVVFLQLGLLVHHPFLVLVVLVGLVVLLGHGVQGLRFGALVVLCVRLRGLHSRWSVTPGGALYINVHSFVVD